MSPSVGYTYRKAQRTNEFKGDPNYMYFLLKKSVSVLGTVLTCLSCTQEVGTVLTCLSCTQEVPQLLMGRQSSVMAEVIFSHSYADCGHSSFFKDVDNLPGNTVSKIIDRSRPVPFDSPFAVIPKCRFDAI